MVICTSQGPYYSQSQQEQSTISVRILHVNCIFTVRVLLSHVQYTYVIPERERTVTPCKDSSASSLVSKSFPSSSEWQPLNCHWSCMSWFDIMSSYNDQRGLANCVHYRGVKVKSTQKHHTIQTFTSNFLSKLANSNIRPWKPSSSCPLGVGVPLSWFTRETSASRADTKNTLLGASWPWTTFSSSTRNATLRSRCCCFTCRHAGTDTWLYFIPTSLSPLRHFHVVLTFC